MKIRRGFFASKIQEEFLKKINSKTPLEDDIDKLMVLLLKFEKEKNTANLKASYEQYKRICDKYPDVELTKYPFGHQINKIFDDLKREAQTLNISIFALDAKQEPSPPSFVAVLETMPVKILQLLTKHLQENTVILKDQTFKSFLNSQAFKDATIATPHIRDVLNNFFTEHTVKCLGSGNSKVFKISKNTGEQPYILKLANNLEGTREGPIHIEGKLKSATLLPSFASIPFLIDNVRYDLMVTPLAGTDLETYFKQNANSIEAISIYTQMTKTFKELLDNDVFFPDPKNSNWQYKNKQLVMADSKSLTYLNSKTKFSGLWHTIGYTPPEFENTEKYYKNKANWEKFYVYVLAVNMKNAFKGQAQIPAELIRLLIACTHRNPYRRPSLETTIKHLQDLQIKDLLRFPGIPQRLRDKQLNDYIASNMASANSLDTSRKEALIKKLQQLNQAQHLIDLNDYIDELNLKKGGLFQVSGSSKAQTIIDNFFKLSIEERLNPNSEGWKKVKSACIKSRTMMFNYWHTQQQNQAQNTPDVADEDSVPVAPKDGGITGGP